MELVRFPSSGGFSVRSIITFALAVIATAFLWVTFSSTPTHAASGTWTDGGVIIFDGHGYNKSPDFKDTTGTVPDGATVYTAPIQTVSGGDQKMFILYFAPGVDPPKATSATYVVFDYDSGSLSNPKSESATITPQGSGEGLVGEVESSCAVGGVGWIICPVTVFLAETMDNLFNLLAGLIEAQPPIVGDDTNGMYVAWNIARTIANVAFVIAFLIIIYSQLTNIGISNYGLKKLIPRLIIAAVLVNVSYYISAIAVDISNILGYSIQDIFNIVREQTFHLTNDNFAAVNNNPWTAVTTVVLAGGGIIGGIYYISTAGTAILVTLLVGLSLTLLFVLLVLAARQAIIVILVIISPLAFVAMLLPNTEKLFDRWKDLFMTMLIFFPAFSLVFGGSQLAGQLIIQNAGDNIVTVIFGLAVQVAPLVITPYLLKFSGGLLGKIAQIANDPRKGVMDRTRGWQKERNEMNRQKALGRNVSKANPFSWIGSGAPQVLENNRRRRKELTDMYKLRADNKWEGGKSHQKIAERREGYEEDKKAIHSRHAQHLSDIKAGRGHSDKHNLYGRALAAQSAKEDAESSENAVSTHYNDLRTRGNSALRASSYALETSKMRLKASEDNKEAFYTEQKVTPGTDLNAEVQALETAKVRLEGSQSSYAATVDRMKINPGTTLNSAVQTAQTAKQQAEAAQARLQSFFDAQNADTTTDMGKSYVDLEQARITGEGTKAQLADYTASLKAHGGTLHTDYVTTERLKGLQQTSEARLTRIIEEYKAGGFRDEDGNIFIDGQRVTGAEETLAREMLTNAENLSAETQGAQSAQREQQRRLSSLFAEEGNTRAEELLRVAGSIDSNGSQRSLATALAQRSRNEKEVLDNIQSIFSFRNIADADVAKLAQGKSIDGLEKTKDTIAAAIQSILSGGNTEEIVNVMKGTDFSFPGMSAEEAEDLRIIASDALMSNSARPPFMTVGFTKALKSGKRFDGEAFSGKLDEVVPGEEDKGTLFDQMIIKAINNGKLDSKKMQGAGKDYMKAVFQAMQAHPELISDEVNADGTVPREALLAELAKTLDPSREASEGLADSLPYLRDMVRNLGGTVEPNGAVKLDSDKKPEQRPKPTTGP